MIEKVTLKQNRTFIDWKYEETNEMDVLAIQVEWSVDFSNKNIPIRSKGKTFNVFIAKNNTWIYFGRKNDRKKLKGRFL